MYDPRKTSGASHPLWVHGTSGDSIGLGGPIADKVDVIVIGAGISGLSTAYHLVQSGCSVLVIDQGRIARGETARSTAHVCTALDDRYQLLERLHGTDGAKLAAESHGQAIASIEAIIAREGIECDFERLDGYLFAGDPHDKSHREEIQHELTAARRAGLEVDAVEDPPLAFEAGTALRFRWQAQLDPYRYALGLARAVEAKGGQFLLDARVVKVDEESPIKVHVESGRTFESDFVVVATNTPIVDKFAMHTKQAAYRSYVVAFSIEPGAIQRALYWDTASPYHYVRLARSHEHGEVLVVGGEDHKVGQSSEPEQAWVRLEAWTRAHFPAAGRVVERWSGQVWEPMDSLAFIGRNPGSGPNVLISTGDSGNGITHGALAGLMLSDRVAGKANRYADLYNPARKMTQAHAAAGLLRENLNVAVAYGGHFTSAIDRRVAPHPLEPGEGMIARRGFARLALYRDELGIEHACTAVCTHLGGPLHWNAAERSWDCPCHGARFDPMGRVITGPATKDLEKVQLDETPLTPAPVLSTPAAEPPAAAVIAEAAANR